MILQNYKNIHDIISDFVKFMNDDSYITCYFGPSKLVVGGLCT